MKTMFRVSVAVLVAGLSLATVHAGQRPASQAAPAAAPEVFCNTMQAGALCPTGTVSILKLSGPKVQQWLDAVNKYNAAVEAAARQLKADAKPVLTAAQQSELDRWLEKGINAEVNKLLASKNAGR
jgi:hypothetical protein